MMTMVKIDKKRKYFLMVAVFLLIAGVAYRIWPQIQDLRGTDGEIEVRKKQLVKYQRMFQAGDDLEKEVAALKKTLKQGESGLLTGKTPALAAADIQKVMQKMAEKSSVEIKRVRVLKPEDVGGNQYLSIPVQLTLNCSTRQLKNFLYQIRASSKYLTVQKVLITANRRRLRRGATKQAESVRGDITVNGFLKKSDAQS
jgi:Tfp pilus assembly protein PilO